MTPNDEQPRGLTPLTARRGLLICQVCAAILGRLALNTARRFVYPFAAVISRGAGIPLTALTGIIAVNQLTGILALILGPVVDRVGYRPMMLLGLALLVVGMLAVPVSPSAIVLLAAMMLAGLGKSIFDPAIQSCIGERVPFQHRARIVGLLEVAWAGSSLLGIPLMGILIDRFGWKSPFWALAGAGLVALAAIAVLTEPPPDRHGPAPLWADMRSAWGRLLHRRSCRGLLAMVFCVSAANDNLFVIYGVWLEGAFGLRVVALGLGTGLIGVAELAGELLTAMTADRIGLKRALGLGLVLAAASYAVLAFCTGALAVALAGLAMVFLFFEFSIVSALSLSTELLPRNRAAMMSAVMAAAGLGRAFGALCAGPLWLSAGMRGICALSAGLTLTGLFFLIYGLKGWSPGAQRATTATAMPGVMAPTVQK